MPLEKAAASEGDGPLGVLASADDHGDVSAEAAEALARLGVAHDCDVVMGAGGGAGAGVGDVAGVWTPEAGTLTIMPVTGS